MAEDADTAIQVAVRVRPLNPRERDDGQRTCVLLDDDTKQVVLTVSKSDVNASSPREG
jgi:hypothetical protein